MLGSRISSRWGCTDLECPEPNLGLTSLCLLTSIIQSLTCGPCYSNESRWCFTPRKSISGTSKGLVYSSVNRYPLYCWFPVEGTEIWFWYSFCCLFLGYWKNRKPHLDRCIRQSSYWFIHFKFLFCTLSDPHQNFPASDVLGSAFRTIWVASFRKKKSLEVLLWCPCDAIILR